MKTRTITVEWEDGDMNDHSFEMDVPENADEDTVNRLVEDRVWDEAVYYCGWHEGGSDDL